MTALLQSKTIANKRSQTNLVRDLQVGVMRRVGIAVAAVAILTTALHISWSIIQKQTLSHKVREAIASNLADYVKNEDLIAIEKILKAFRQANENASICVKLHDGSVIAQPSCDGAEFKEYFVPLSQDKFHVSVQMPTLDWMALAGVPVLFGVLALIWLVMLSLRRLAQRITQDIDALSSLEDNSTHFTYAELADARSRIEEGLKLREELSRKKAEAAFAERLGIMGHNIESPARAISGFATEICESAGVDSSIVAQAQSIAKAAGRILGHTLEMKETTKELLLKSTGRNEAHQQKQLITTPPLEKHLLSSLIDDLVQEKRAQYRSYKNIDIQFDLKASAYGLFARMNRTEFLDILSNLINNSIEAIGADKKGFVAVGLSSRGNTIDVSVQDNGNGVPESLLPSLMSKGVTHKNSGTGLGLYHARAMVESWGGKVSIQSEEKIGTIISLSIPRAEEPLNFVRELKVQQRATVVVFDDDAIIHALWKMRFKEACIPTHEITFYYFSTPEQLRDWHTVHSKTANAVTYLMDYQITGYGTNGLRLIEELGIAAQSILVTSQSDDKSIVDKCTELNVRMIPKALMRIVPISIQAEADSTATPDYVLIDDDEYTRGHWQKEAAKNKVKLLSVCDPRDLLDSIHGLDTDTPIYVDENISDEVKGRDLTLVLHKAGFKNLFLSTALPAEFFSPIPWIKGIVDKSPPWLVP